jgi:essential nuclear protein 1
LFTLGLRHAEGLAAEEAILRKFMPDAQTERRTLADIIMEKIKEKEEAAAATAAAADDGEEALDPKIVEVYTEVGRYLSHYRSGKLPKVFKVIPGLSNWEEILFLTNPETWTPHATYAATRIFASNFNPAKAQRFFNLILLPKCRDDIYFNKRLNFHLYISLKKATYKPAAFYKGIILPLAAEPDVTLREAIIFGSVVSKVSIPQIHSAATLMKLSEMRYNGGISVLVKVRETPIFIVTNNPAIHSPRCAVQTLVNKKYTLPYLVVDAVAKHFAQFLEISGPLPVIWHQSLLAFVQRYKADLTADQKDIVRQLLHIHVHHSITPEIRREVFSAGCRGDAPTMPLPSVHVPGLPAAAPVRVIKEKQSAAMDVEY